MDTARSLVMAHTVYRVYCVIMLKLANGLVGGRKCDGLGARLMARLMRVRLSRLLGLSKVDICCGGARAGCLSPLQVRSGRGREGVNQAFES